MSGETRASISGWTIDTYASHQEALQAHDAKYEAMRDRLGGQIDALRDKLTASEDRRYSEVATEREKALKIKETADLAALGLAREIQTYKDEKANQLREQINSERGLYATKSDLTAAVEKIGAEIKPLGSAIEGMRGNKVGLADGRLLLTWGLGVLVALMALYTFTQRSTPAPIYTPAPFGTVLPSNPPQAVPR